MSTRTVALPAAGRPLKFSGRILLIPHDQFHPLFPFIEVEDVEMIRKSTVLMAFLAMLAAAGSPGIVKADMGLGISDKYEIVKPANVFTNDTPEIFCVWKADAPQGIETRGVWIAEDVGKIAEPNHKITEATEKMPFSRAGNFSLTKPNNGWPVGKYRLEIYLGNKLVKSLPFTIRPK